MLLVEKTDSTTVDEKACRACCRLDFDLGSIAIFDAFLSTRYSIVQKGWWVHYTGIERLYEVQMHHVSWSSECNTRVFEG